MTRLTVWSDYVCPFAYVGHLRLRRAQKVAPDAVIEWLPFELHPETPPQGAPRADLRRVAEAAGAGGRRGVLRELLDEEGVRLRPSSVQFSSRLALQAAEYARDAGAFDAMHDRLFAAAFEDGLDLGRADVLGELADEVGLDGRDLVGVVTAHGYLHRIVDALEAAMFAGVTGTPTYRCADNSVLRGVQPVARLEEALT
ncbi:MAG TPA: DsbA family protein [Acidimicrobiia bacterium]|nr:DsbA family protein [Acidimicrobiia bacterium]